MRNTTESVHVHVHDVGLRALGRTSRDFATWRQRDHSRHEKMKRNPRRVAPSVEVTKRPSGPLEDETQR